jgi:hypothetical protein
VGEWAVQEFGEWPLLHRIVEKKTLRLKLQHIVALSQQDTKKETTLELHIIVNFGVIVQFVVMPRRRWRLAPAVAGGDSERQRLMAAMDEGGRSCLTVG